MNPQEIQEATTKELHARQNDLFDGEQPEYPDECKDISAELRWREEHVVSIIKQRAD